MRERRRRHRGMPKDGIGFRQSVGWPRRTHGETVGGEDEEGALDVFLALHAPAVAASRRRAERITVEVGPVRDLGDGGRLPRRARDANCPRRVSRARRAAPWRRSIGTVAPRACRKAESPSFAREWGCSPAASCVFFDRIAVTRSRARGREVCELRRGRVLLSRREGRPAHGLAVHSGRLRGPADRHPAPHALEGCCHLERERLRPPEPFPLTPCRRRGRPHAIDPVGVTPIASRAGQLSLGRLGAVGTARDFKQLS